jgi:DNA (cytosine-5)-methyltransferase 1
MRFEDIQHINSGRRIRRWAAQTLPIDLVCGGFPCTDISSAGKRAGIHGEHSGLWCEYARVLRLLRPRYVVVENVAALLHRGMGTVLRDLSACGYDAIWDVVPASAIGAPHRRERVFVVAWRVSDAERNGVRNQPERRQGAAQAANRGNPFARALGAILADGDRRGQESVGNAGEQRAGGEQGARGDEPNRCGEELGNRERQRLQGIQQAWAAARTTSRSTAWPPGPNELHAWGRVSSDAQPAVCRLADGLPAGLLRDRRAKLKALGNAVVPAVGEVIGRVVLEIERKMATTD